MGYKPSDFFIGSFEFFSVIIPGAIGTYILWFLFKDTQLSSAFPIPAGTAAWIAFAVTSFILGYAVQPPSHILNRLYDYTYRRYQRRKGDPLLDFATSKAKLAIPNITKTGSVYEWTRVEVLAKDPSIKDDVEKTQGVSKLFRSLCFFVLIGVLGAFWLKQWSIGGVLLVAAVVFFLIFCERRWSASSLVYQRYMGITPSTPPKKKAT
jgi:hypothetical protein